ncbi:ABC transporter permease [Microbacterium sp. F51-2R]|uniref:ABC transporter permease n=1 Tax=Microbacterium sp. F51-2R TaxID=3445777 RepID=UPI003FA0C32A
MSGQSFSPNPRLIEVSASPRVNPRVLGLLGVGILLVLYELVARSGIFGNALLPIGSIVAAWTDPVILAVLGRNFPTTLGAAVVGYILGTLFGVSLALLARYIGWSRRLLQRVAVLTWVIPMVALGPLLMLTLDASVVPTVISAWFVFFWVFVPTLSGLQVSFGAQADFFRISGSRGFPTFTHLQLPTALPYFADGLRLAAPAAVMGAVFGEWFGITRGIGVVILSSMQNAQVQLMWVAATAVTAVAIGASILLTLLQRFLHGRYGE